MKDMSRYQQGMGFYAQMPDAYNLVLNADHPLIKKVIADETAKTAEALKPVLAEIKGQEARLTILRQEQNKKKPEEITQEEKDDLSNTQKAIDEHKNQKKQIIADAAKDNKIVRGVATWMNKYDHKLKGWKTHDCI
jgi:molecular chaperone HtpG